jgi:hypothetical protein
MDKPLEIAFHGMASSPNVEAEILDHVDKLEHRFGHLTGCRVAVELLHHQHKTGNLYDVHVEMQVLGGGLVVSRAPHRPRAKYAHPDRMSACRSLQSGRKAIDGNTSGGSAARSNRTRRHSLVRSRSYIPPRITASS